MPALEARDVKAGYGERLVVPELSLSLAKGEIASVIGANGSGKSTILKTLGRLLAPKGGCVLLDGLDVRELDAKELAKRLSVLPQVHGTPEGLRVRDFVAYGRFPHLRAFQALSKRDVDAIEKALELTGLESLAARSLATLSGGERQRAWIALNLAQEPETMLLDEPTSFLDVRHQLETLELVRRMNRSLGLTVVMVLHDLNHAARFSHRVIAIKDGRVWRQGTPAEIVTSELVREVFGVESRIVMDAGCPHFIPLKPCEGRRKGA